MNAWQFDEVLDAGFTVTGYRPGTPFVAAEGKRDAWATIAGGVLGACTVAFLFPALETALISLGWFGPVTLHGALGLPG